MSKTNLHTTEQWGDATAVNGEVREVVGHNGCRSDGGLEHANERVAVKWLNYLLLHLKKEVELCAAMMP